MKAFRVTVADERDIVFAKTAERARYLAIGEYRKQYDTTEWKKVESIRDPKYDNDTLKTGIIKLRKREVKVVNKKEVENA